MHGQRHAAAQRQSITDAQRTATTIKGAVNCQNVSDSGGWPRRRIYRRWEPDR